jgi:hypothetical protein
MNKTYVFFHSMKLFFLALTVITICTVCKKNSAGIIQSNIESSVLSEDFSSVSNSVTQVSVDEIIIQPVQEEEFNAVVNDNAVRIRDQPSLEGTVIRHLNQGMKVDVVGRSRNRMFLEGYDSYWLKIRKDDVDGWVYGAYIDLLNIQYDSLNIIISTNRPAGYFNEEFLERALKNPNLPDENIIFDRLKVLGLWKDGVWGLWMDGLRVYHGGRLFYGSDILKRYIEYGNYHIILVTQEIGCVEYVCDYLIIEKQNPEAHLSNGAVKINGEYGDWEVDIVVNHHWRGRFTDDISQAFKVNSQTKKIEPFIYDTIRLYSED